MDIDIINECKTPSSIASSPRDGFSAQSPTDTIRQAAEKLAHSSKSRSPRSTPEAFLLHDLWLSARHTRRDTNGLHSILRRVHNHIASLQNQLNNAHLEMERQQQVATTAIMEKKCEIKMAQSEAEAYKLAAYARAATLTALEMQLHRLTAAHTESQSSSELSTLKHAYTTLESTLSSTQKDAATVAGRLLEACEENALLSDTLTTSELQIGALEKQVDQFKQKEVNLQSSIEKMSAENSRLHGNLLAAREEICSLKKLIQALKDVSIDEEKYIATTRLKSSLDDHVLDDDLPLLYIKNTEEEGRRSPQNHQHNHNHTPESRYDENMNMPIRASNPFATLDQSTDHTHSTATGNTSNSNTDDLLALELLHLRQEKSKLELKLAETQDALPLIDMLRQEAAALRNENSALRDTAVRYQDESLKSRRELQHVQSEAQALHGQLSDVIASLATAGVSSMGVTMSPLKKIAHRASTSLDDTVDTVDASSNGVDSSYGNRHPLSVPHLHHDQGIHVCTHDDVVEQNQALPRWKEPQTPTSEIHSMSKSIQRYQTTESDSNSDMVITELKTAMASLDPVAYIAAKHAEHKTATTLGNNNECSAVEDSGGDCNVRVLEALSQGMASLNCDDNK